MTTADLTAAESAVIAKIVAPAIVKEIATANIGLHKITLADIVAIVDAPWEMDGRVYDETAVILADRIVVRQFDEIKGRNVWYVKVRRYATRREMVGGIWQTVRRECSNTAAHFESRVAEYLTAGVKIYG